MTIWRVRIACWIPKATDTNAEYVILAASSLQQWLEKHASVLLYMYTADLVKLCYRMTLSDAKII
jgi:hypothetical protein